MLHVKVASLVWPSLHKDAEAAAAVVVAGLRHLQEDENSARSNVPASGSAARRQPARRTLGWLGRAARVAHVRPARQLYKLVV